MNTVLETSSKLLDDIIAEDPIEFQDLCIGEEESKQLILMNMTEKYFELKDKFSEKDFDSMMVAIMSKLALETYVYYVKDLTKH